MTIEKFTRVGDNFFAFNYKLQGILYSSIVRFEYKCTDEQFLKMLPQINDNLCWLEGNLIDIKTQVDSKLPHNTDLTILGKCNIVSFSLLFNKDDELIVNIAYGYGGGVYLSSNFKNKKICEVGLNQFRCR